MTTDPNHYASPGTPPWIQTPPKPRRGLPAWAWVSMILGGLAIFCGCMTVIGVFADSPRPDPAPPVVSLEPTTVPTVSPTTVPPTSDAPTTSSPAVPPPISRTPVAQSERTIEDGLYRVGEDVPAGTYRMAEPVTSGDFCYWRKSRDAEGSQIIDNDLAGVGRLQVTLKTGQWFETTRCGTWVRK